jgi:uncharacterized protein (DUF934 family)
MAQIIRNRAIVTDDFSAVADEVAVPQGKKVVVSWARYVADPGVLLGQVEALGIRVPSDKLPKDIPELHKLALICIEFPRFTDGRGYSVARLLREREKFQGELRAVGWVLRDNLLNMERVGFNAFDLREGKPLESAVQAFAELPIAYQATVADPRPLYRRR